MLKSSHKIIIFWVLLFLWLNFNVTYANENVFFNVDLLDIQERENIDFSRFESLNYIAPGDYELDIVINNQSIMLKHKLISFYEHVIDNHAVSEACFNHDLIESIPFTSFVKKNISYNNDNGCAEFKKISGIRIKPVINEGKLYINAPTVYFTYNDDSFPSPEVWDDGISGVILDYNIDDYILKQKDMSYYSNISYYGTTGINIDAWRLRGDYYGSFEPVSTVPHDYGKKFNWGRLRLYRTIRTLAADLYFGEIYNNSYLFDSWRYLGINLKTDIRQLPPVLRSFAPSISGVANSTSRVVISQGGHVYIDRWVAPGVWIINELPAGVSGLLDVRVIGSDGEENNQSIEVIDAPYLMRPGSVRYNLALGKVQRWEHDNDGYPFFTGEVSMGINNNFSLSTGGILSSKYFAYAVGGSALIYGGQLDTTVIQTESQLDNKSLNGGLWSVQMSKGIESYNMNAYATYSRSFGSQYLGLQEFDYLKQSRLSLIDATTIGLTSQYSIGLRKRTNNQSIDLRYQHGTNNISNSKNKYILTWDSHINFGIFRDLDLNISVSREIYQNWRDDVVYTGFSIPFGDAFFNYNMNKYRGKVHNGINVSGRFNNNMSSYNISASMNNDRYTNSSMLGLYYSEKGTQTNWSAQLYSEDHKYRSANLQLSGGVTATQYGVVMHSGGYNGNTRLLIDANGVKNISIDNGSTYTNSWGLAVKTELNSYTREPVAIDMNNSPNDLLVGNPIGDVVLTAGAIGYHNFNIQQGDSLFASIRMVNHSYPPFGAGIVNQNGMEVGIVGEHGDSYISAVKPDEELFIKDGNISICHIILPPNFGNNKIILPCE